MISIKSKIMSLNLAPNSYIVVGSGILQALEIRSSDDIDMVVSREVFDKLDQTGVWQHSKWGEQDVLKRDIFDIGMKWAGKDIEELLLRAEIVDDIPYLSIGDLREWKNNTGRPKDVRDIQLIDSYLEDSKIV